MKWLENEAKEWPSVGAARSRLYAPFEDYTMAEVANQAGHASEQTTAVYTNMTWEIIIPWI